MINISMKKVVRGGLAISMVAFLGAALGADVRAQDAYSVPDGAVQVYGQTLRPDLIKAPDDFYSWSQIKDIMPKILPDAQKASQSKESVCKDMIALYNEYGTDMERVEYMLFDGANLADDADPFPGEDFAVAISQRVRSPDPKSGEELMAAFPDVDPEKIKMAREGAKYYAVTLYLHDAALENCAEYAAEEKLYMILNYNGPDADYDPEQDAGWDALEKQWEAERAAKPETPGR